MVPENIYEKAKKILINNDFSEGDSDEVIVEQKEPNIYYAYVKSQKRGSFGQAIIDGNDLSFLFANSTMSPDNLLTRFKGDLRTVGAVRRNVHLPIVQDGEIANFAKKLVGAFNDCYGVKKSSDDPLSEYYDKMLYNAVVLLLSAKDSSTRLIQLTMVYHNVDMVKRYLATVKDRAAHDYWTKEVSQFVKKDKSAFIIHLFDVRVASLIGEQRIQDICRRYKA